MPSFDLFRNNEKIMHDNKYWILSTSYSGEIKEGYSYFDCSVKLSSSISLFFCLMIQWIDKNMKRVTIASYFSRKYDNLFDEAVWGPVLQEDIINLSKIIWTKHTQT